MVTFFMGMGIMNCCALAIRCSTLSAFVQYTHCSCLLCACLLLLGPLRNDPLGVTFDSVLISPSPLQTFVGGELLNLGCGVSGLTYSLTVPL